MTQGEDHYYGKSDFKHDRYHSRRPGVAISDPSIDPGGPAHGHSASQNKDHGSERLHSRDGPEEKDADSDHNGAEEAHVGIEEQGWSSTSVYPPITKRTWPCRSKKQRRSTKSKEHQ